MPPIPRDKGKLLALISSIRIMSYAGWSIVRYVTDYPDGGRDVLIEVVFAESITPIEDQVRLFNLFGSDSDWLTSIDMPMPGVLRVQYKRSL
jgi:hypothetical protein